MAVTGVQALERAFDILDILSLEPEGLGVTQIAERAALHKSTAHRIVSALAERGYIEKSPNGNLYRIGLKMVDIASVYLNNVELKTEARPFLRDLTQKTGFTSHLAILDGMSAVYIDKVDMEQHIRLYSQIGRRIPTHCSALGKCLLSGLPANELDERLKNYPFTVFTEHTLTGASELCIQVNRVRVDGYAIDDEEHDPGIRCLASPVFDYRGKVAAAVSVAGPVGNLPQKRVPEAAALVMQTAAEISVRMGFRGSMIR